MIILSLILALSCNKDIDDDLIKQENGNVWLSGVLAYCAQQTHLDSGDTLIVKIEDIISFKSGDRVKIKYKEIGTNEFCSVAVDCEIIEIISLIKKPTCKYPAPHGFDLKSLALSLYLPKNKFRKS